MGPASRGGIASTERPPAFCFQIMQAIRT